MCGMLKSKQEEKRKLVEELLKVGRITDDEYSILLMDDVLIPTYTDGQYDYQIDMEKLDGTNVA